MKERIEPADICTSPHRKPYEEFIQIDLLKQTLPFAHDKGLYGLVSRIFPIKETLEEPFCATTWIYPFSRTKKGPTSEEIKKAVEDQFEGGKRIYAGQDVFLPGDPSPLVQSGEYITKSAQNRIIEHNIQSLKGKKIPLKRVIAINPLSDAETEILGRLLKRKDFVPARVKRRLHRKISLLGYSLRLPFTLDEPGDESAWHITVAEMARECQQYGKSLQLQVMLHFEITEKSVLSYQDETFETGEQEVTKRAPLVNLPLFTSKETFIIKGLERAPVCQLLPRPGLHLLREELKPPAPPLLSALVRPERGSFLKLKIPFDATKDLQSIKVEVGMHEFDLTAFLRAMGFFEQVEKAIKKAGATMPSSQGTLETVVPYWSSRIKSHLFLGKEDYDLGKGGRESLNNRLADCYRKCAVQEPSKRFLQVEDLAALLLFLLEASLSDTPPLDDPMDLSNSKVYTIRDQLQDRMQLLLPWLDSRVRFFLRNRRDIRDVPLNFSGPKGKVSKHMDALFQGELSQIVDDTNPLSELSLKRKVTLLGPRGIRQTYGNFERRGVHFSHYGRLCLSETPESQNIGLNLYLALAAKVEQGSIKSPFLAEGVSSAETRWLAPADEKDELMAPKGHDAFPEIGDRVLVRDGTAASVVTATAKQITLRDKYRAQFLGLGANLIPFVQHDDNNRVMMGAKNMKQAVPLLHPEEPLIKTGREELVAKICGHAAFARSDGTVESVTEQAITVRNEDGDRELYPLAPLSATFCHTLTWQRTLVKKGDKVRKDQPLADGACTKNGQLALGTNLLTAYMPYYGLNFEDGIVISDRLVKSDVLTSIHVSSHAFEVYGNERMSSGENVKEMLYFTLYHGVFCRVGQEVSRGDKLFAKYRLEGSKTRIEWMRSPVSGTVVDLYRQEFEPQTVSERRLRYRYICFILEERKVSVGDKLMGRHGNKGVVSRILPSEQMPHLMDGTPVDIILNPHGVISRMNLGQIMETHVGWIVKKGGQKFQDLSVIAPFERIAESRIRDAFLRLAHTGIDREGKAVLVDGRSGQIIKNRVMVGYQYFMKLNHLVDDKINTRETAGYTLLTRQPVKGRKRTGGQRMGEMENWALESHLAHHLIQEFMTVKSDAIKLRVKDLAARYFDKQSPLRKRLPVQETLRITVMLLRALCFDVTLQDGDGKPISFEGEDLSRLEGMKIRLADSQTILAWARGRVISDPRAPSLRKGKVLSVPKGLFDGTIFKNPRTDMACIELVEPVIHPLYLSRFLKKVKGLAREKKKSPELEEIFKINKASEAMAAVRFESALVRGPEGLDRRILERRNFYEVPLYYQILSCECGQTARDAEIGSVCGVCGKPIVAKRAYTSFHAGAQLVNELFGKRIEAPLSRALLTHIPVLPMDFRPLFAHHGEFDIKSDLNDLYRAILEANSALGRALESRTPYPGRGLFFLRARLQQAVKRLMTGDNFILRKGIRSIGDRIKGKEGILRKYHLGKRVDMSARSVIVPMPEIELDQVGIPLEMAAGLMRSRLVEKLSEKCNAGSKVERREQAQAYLDDLRAASNRRLIQKTLFDSKNGLLKDIFFILTRAPSLHKYNVLAFRPVCVDHKAIGLHPLVCKFFNADFDGDQMGVFLPLSEEANAEAGERLSPFRNLLSAANGKIMLHFDQDVVLGIYLLTSSPKGQKDFNSWFKEAGLPPITAPVSGRELTDRMLQYHIRLGNPEKTAKLSQKIMAEGFRRATLHGLTFSIFDVPLVDFGQKQKLLTGTLPESSWREECERIMKKEFGIAYL